MVVPHRQTGSHPFISDLPDGDELAACADMALTPFDLPTEDTPVTAVSDWQRDAPPPLPPESRPTVVLGDEPVFDRQSERFTELFSPEDEAS